MDLQQAARDAGVRGKDIAAALGVSRPTVSEWLARKTPVPSTRVRALAAMLKIDPLDVLPPEKPVIDSVVRSLA